MPSYDHVTGRVQSFVHDVENFFESGNKNDEDTKRKEEEEKEKQKKEETPKHTHRKSVLHPFK